MCTLSQQIKTFLENFEKESEKELKKKLIEFLSEDEKGPLPDKDFKRMTIDLYFGSEQVPDLEWFKSLSESQLQTLIQKDNSYFDLRLVHRACKQNKPTELVIYLIEKGFKTFVHDPKELIKNGNLELIKYYAKNPKFKEKWDMCYGLHQAVLVIKREDILKFLVENKVHELDEDVKRDALEGAVDQCIRTSSINMLKILLDAFPSIIIRYVKSMYDREVYWRQIFKPSNQFLLWLWDNNMKWTKEQAEKLKNPFMCSFFQ